MSYVISHYHKELKRIVALKDFQDIEMNKNWKKVF